MQMMDELFIWQQYQQMLKICNEKMIMSELRSLDWRVKAAANLAIGDLIAKECKAPDRECIELLIDNLFDRSPTDKKWICVQCARRSLIIASAKRSSPDKPLSVQDLRDYGVDFGPVITSSADGTSADKDNKVCAERWEKYFNSDIKNFKIQEGSKKSKK